MSTLQTVTAATIAMGFMTACASTSPPQELVAARSAYNQASHGPAANLDPADLHVARQTLDAAEQAFAQDTDAQETRDLAYTAERRAETASVRADAVRAIRQRDQALAQMSANQSAQVALTSAQLQRTQQALTAEQQRTADAERRAAEATSDLARLGSVKQDARGTVITLSGSVLFASNKADILPTGRSRLNDVADALLKQDSSTKILVEGFTDSRGGADLNQDLSQRRAESVRAYLIKRGVHSDQLSAEGMGAADPIADNATAEGRANNRRVELVVQRAGKQ